MIYFSIFQPSDFVQYRSIDTLFIFSELGSLTGLQSALGEGVAGEGFQLGGLLISTILLALVPFAFLGTTSFLKINLVFSALKNALGAQNFPSSGVVSMLSIALTLQIMAPVWRDSYLAVSKTVEESGSEPANATAHQGKSKTQASGVKRPTGSGEAQLTSLIRICSSGAVPLEAFMRKHSVQRDRVFFANAGAELLNGFDRGEDRSIRRSAPGNSAEVLPEAGRLLKKSGAGSLPGENLFTLLPAFLVSQLSEAFMLGFAVFLPFLVIDLVVSNILLSLGMMMVNPSTISLPFKILLFALSDGWFLLSKSLLLGYH